MSILSKIFGGGGAADAVTAVGGVFDELFTSEEEKLNAAAVMEKLKQQPAVLQMAINKVEAGHRSVFVAGWRPYIGWVCGSALAYHFIIQPFLVFVILAAGWDLPPLPEFEMTTLTTILTGLLGLGGLRTVEKIAGRAK